MRECIFCQGRASTKEDVWPQWLTKRFPLSDISFMEAELAGHKLDTWRSKTAKLLRVRCVCENCNGGWMSRLEGQVRPVIESILDDRMKTVDVSSQALIATWAVKTAITLEAIKPQNKWFYTNDQRRELRMVSAIPERTSVWIAKCVNQANLYSAAKDLLTTHGQNEVYAYVTTMAFGSFAVQVASIKPHMNLPKGTAITFDVSGEPWEKVLIQVWPMPKLHWWPPITGLAGDLGIEALTNRLSRSGINIISPAAQT
jgi:hypothetical protein